MSEEVRRVRRIRQIEKVSEPPKLSRKRRVRIPTHRKLSEVLEVPERGNSLAETKAGTVRRWRLEEELLRACLAEGMTRTYIKKILGVGDKDLGVIEKRLLANEGQPFINQSTAHRFFTYTLQQEQCVRDLEYVLSSIIAEMDMWNEAYQNRLNDESDDEDGSSKPMPPKPSAQAAIMAIKAKSEIHDRTIRMGQDLGLIEKRAKELRVSGNLNLAALPTEELRVVLDKKLKEFQALVGEGRLPTVYERMIKNRTAPHDRAARNGRDGSNLDPIIG
jgi:hypothetical protein